MKRSGALEGCRRWRALHPLRGCITPRGSCIVSRESENERDRERRWKEKRERERGRALPGTLEVNVLRMVGRCLVCSRLISTWVSSLEPPPSTPSTVLHLHTHSHTHTHTIHQNRQSCSTTERIQRHRHQEACVLLHRSKFMSVSYVSPSRLLFPSPVRGSNPLSNPTAIRFFHSPSYSADVSRTARSLVQPVNNRAPLL